MVSIILYDFDAIPRRISKMSISKGCTFGRGNFSTACAASEHPDVGYRVDDWRGDEVLEIGRASCRERGWKLGVAAGVQEAEPAQQRTTEAQETPGATLDCHRAPVVGREIV